MKQTKTNIFRAFLALLMGLVFLPNAAKAQTIEDGTAEHPFLIQSEQELWDFHDCMVPGSTFYFYDGAYTMSKPAGTEGVDYITIPSGCKGKHVKLTTDIVINKGNVAGCNGIKDSTWKAWTPMEIFNGHFDGGYHVVSGLFCTDRDSSLNKIHERGFFTQISDSASVSRLGVVNSYISGAKAVGGITGYLINHSTVEECFFEGTLESYDVNTGGIVGISEMTTDIRNCYSSGRIYAERHYVGGIIGNCHAATNVANCYSNMMIISDGSVTGGIYGYNYGMGNVTNCYYDKQMSTLNTDFNVPGLLTRTMTDVSWQVLGDRFETLDGYYPHIRGFSMGSPMVAMSVTPIFLNATDDNNYDKVDELANDFDLGGASSGAVWSATSWNDAITVADESYHATVNKEGIVDLIVRRDTLQRTYIIIPHKAPFLGSEENPFIIDNLTDLTNFRNGINSGKDFVYRRFDIPYINLPNIHWLQTSDIDMASVSNWTPVGNSEKPFKGYYNGGNKNITNLYCSTKNVYSGLFGYANNANFSNLVFLRDTFTNATYDLGVLCGYIKNSHVTNCTIHKCYVESNASNNSYSTGGFCGYAENSSIDHCTNDSSNIYGYHNTGGIIGKTKSSQVSYCHNNAPISHKGKVDSYKQAGIAAWVEGGNFTFCSNTGTITGFEGTAGIIGRVEGTVTVKYCFNTGDLTTFTKASTAGPGGIVSYNVGTCNVYYCFNTGSIIANYDSPNNTGGVGGYNVTVHHSFNVGKIVGGNSASNTYSGISNGKANYAYNAGYVEGKYNLYPTSATSSNTVLYDNAMCTDQINNVSQGRSTSQLIGTESIFKSVINNESDLNNWIFEDGMYPRLAWTDSLDWARDIAIAACTPVILSSSEQDVNHVKPGMKLMGCNSNVVWKQMPQESGVQGGCLFVDLAQDIAGNECEENAVIPRLNDICIGPTTIGAYTGGQLVKLVKMRRYVEPTKDTLTIDNFADLDTLRKGVNSNEAFYYKEHLLPPYADSIYFRITADIAMSISQWTSIGGVDELNHFGGNILGEGHTISNLHSNGTYAGLFGRATGKFTDLHFTGVSITGGSYKGALCAELIGGKVENCTVSGSVSGGSSNTGGLIGYCSGKDSIINCKNYATVSCSSSGVSGGIVGLGNANTCLINCENQGNITGNSYAGGIIGNGGTVYNASNTGIILGSGYAGGICGNGNANNSHNTAPVTGNSYVGGICGKGNANVCYNTGEVTGNGNTSYLGGISGNGTVKQCYNVATITAAPGNVSSNNYVGGIVGNGNPENCYNAGIIYGNNRKYVGGICGSGNPKNCYNSNTARSDGTYLGGITASGTPTNCCYDQQLCIPNVTIAGAEGKNTEDMLTNSLSALSTTTPSVWTFSELLYPQLSAFAGTAPSVSSVMPVALSNNEKWNKVSLSFYMHGCDAGDWNLQQGNCVRLDTASGHCQTAVLAGFGVVQLGAAVNDTVYRKVRILVNISEENPIVIKSYTELKNFAKVINSSVGYYNSTAQTFHTTMEEAGANMVEIKDGGLDLFFKLIVDIDVPASDPVWTPIGDYKSNTAYRFRGDFNADHHTIKGMKFGAGDYQGLFGYTDGAKIYDLTMDSCSMTGNGTYKGMLCGLNNGTDITNCNVMHSTASGASTNTGMLVGGNQYAVITNCQGSYNTMSVTDQFQGDICGYDYWGTIKHCSSSHFTLYGNGSYAGGISGRNHYSTTDSCLVEDLQATGKSTGYVGGIGGNNVRGTVSHCEVRNSKIDMTGPHVGGIVGDNYTSSSYSGNVNPVVQYCSTENVILKSSGNNVGGIIGRHYGSSSGATCRYCTTNGGTVTGTGSYTGGIVGYAQDGTNKILKCTNNNPVSGVGYVGGILGYTTNGTATTIDTCVNNALVTATGNYAGGILGYGYNISYVKNSYNTGDVKGTSYVGGIEGYQYYSNSAYVTACFNEGRITGSGNYVGGILGQLVHGKVTHSYNTGIVKGTNFVGGIMGNISSTNQTSTLNYNIGWVEGGSYIGAICGNGGESYLTDNFYDKQMVPCKGISSGIVNKDVAGTIAKTTNEMLNDGLSAKLGATNWTYTPDMYPRLKVWDTTNAALTSVQPVRFTCTETDTVCAQDVPTGNYGLSCSDGTSWVSYMGNGLSINDDCSFTVDGRNYVEIANVRQNDTMKVVRMSLSISEEHPLDIVNLEQFRKFRDLINTAQTFYYDDETQTFYAEANEDYVKIDPCGDKMFFRLTQDMDLTLETTDWTPIGSSTANSFKGHFNGAGHTVTGVQITSNNSYLGLFGLSYGTLKNLKVANPKISGAGTYVGAVVGYNRGVLDNCSTEGGYVKGKTNVGGVAGYTTYAPIDHCYNSADVSGGQNVGGVIGKAETSGSINRCFNMGMVSATNATGYVGGVVGYTGIGTYYCYNVGAVNGKNYMGGVVGYSQTSAVKWCYNAGLVNSTNDSKTYVGAVLSTNSTSYFPTACYYDKQLSDVSGGIGYQGQLDNVGKTTGLFTEEMVGETSGTQAGLVTTEWVYESGRYPKLKSMETLDASIASVQPVYITEHLKCRELSLPFTVSMEDGVVWSHYGSSYALDLEDIANGNVGISICGEDTLQVKKNAAVKVVPLYVEKMAAVAVVDTACDGYYRWAANGRYYTQSDSITIALSVTEGCDSLMSLYLTIPPALSIDMKSKNYDCYESTDAYAEATVTGGFEQGYIYAWTKDGDTVSTSKRIDIATCGEELFGPGTYYLSVRDSMHPSCEKSTEVTITRPEPLQIAVDYSDGMCYNQNDGYVAIDVKGGTMPYVVSWSEDTRMDVSTACKDTITGLAAGTYTIKVTDAMSCVKDTVGVDLTEDVTEYAVTAFAVNKMYDGIAENPARYILKIGTGAADTLASDSCKVLANGDTLRAHVSVTDTAIKDVTTLSNDITCTITSEEGEDVTCRYNVTTHNSNVIISKRDVILTSASAQKEYDEQPLTAPTVTVSGSGFVGDEGVESYNVTGSQTEAGASLNTFEYTLKSNTNPDNYQISKVEGTLVVGPQGYLTVIANSNTKIYDGTALVDTGFTYVFPSNDDGEVLGVHDTILAKVTGAIIDVGTVANRLDSLTIRVLDKDSLAVGLIADRTNNYLYAPVVHGKLTITKRNVTVTTAGGEKVYDGTPITNAQATVSGDGFVEGELTSCTATGTITNVGETDNTVKIVTAGNYKPGNYAIDTVLGKLTVNKRSLNIIGDSRSIAYDGQPHELNTYTAPNLVSGHVISGIGYLASGKDKGPYPGAFTGTAGVVIKDTSDHIVTGNYDITFTPGALNIGQSVLPLVVKSNSRDFMYDGQKKKYQDYTVLYNNVSVPATSPMNYTLPTGDALVITPKDKGADGITHVSESGKNAFDITLDNRSFYSNITLDTGMIRITPREVELRSNGEWSLYTGLAIPTVKNDTCVQRTGYGFPTGEGVTCTITGSQVEVGSSKNTFTYVFNSGTQATDYDIDTTYGTLTVAKAPLKIVAVDTNKYYGEENPVFAYTFQGFVHNEDTLHGAPFLTTSTRPVLTTTAELNSPSGQYPINVDVTGVEFQNYTVEAQDGILTVRRRPLKIEALSVTKTYDGVEHTWAETAAPHYRILSVEHGGLLAKDSVKSIVFAGSRIVGGVSQIEPSNVLVDHYGKGSLGQDSVWNITSCYDPEYVNGKLTITPEEITLKPIGLQRDFDGHTYNSDSTAAPHYVLTGTLVANDTILGMTISGQRSAYGKTPFVIDSTSIRIVNKTDESVRNAGYHITLLTDTLSINHRSTPYEITLQGKSDSLVYNGQLQNYFGWDTTKFEFDGFVYEVVDITSRMTNKDTVNTYTTDIVGTARVLGAGGEDVSAEFHVTAHPGQVKILPKPLTLTAYGVDVEYDFMEHNSYKDKLHPYCWAEGLCTGHTITKIALTGTRIAVGREPIHIIKDSVVIENSQQKAVTRNYVITTIDSAIHITDRTSKDTFHLVSKSKEIIYDGTAHTLTGFDTLRYMVRANDAQRTPIYFTIDGVSATTASATTVGEYVNAITGTPVVKDANMNDVSGSFVVVVDTGKMTITKRPITFTARDTTFYTDGNSHSSNDMHDPKYTISGDGLAAGHTAEVTVESASISSLGTTPIKITSVVIKDAGGSDVTSNYDTTTVPGTLKIEGYLERISISSASAEFEVDGNRHRKNVYKVLYDGNEVTEVNADGNEFTLPTRDKLTIYSTYNGVKELTDNRDSNNTFTYTLENNAQYIGLRDTTFGTLRIYDSLHVEKTVTPATCYGISDGTATLTITGGKTNLGNYKYKLDTQDTVEATSPIELTSLGYGEHTFLLKDSLNYTRTVKFTIEQPDTLMLSLAGDNVVCSDGTIMALSTGGNTGDKTFTLTSAGGTSQSNGTGLFNELPGGDYTITVTDTKNCEATGNFTVGTSTYTMPYGVTKKGSLTQYAKDTTVNEQGELTRFPALTRSGERVAQPALGPVTATLSSGAINVSVEVTSPTFAPVLEFQVSTTSNFENAYTYKIVQVTEGMQNHRFDLPSGTYYVRAKLYNCSDTEGIVSTRSGSVTVN